MKLYILCAILFLYAHVHGQMTCSATENNGSGYSIINTSGLAIETPDCIHPEFGPHITQIFDSILNRPVFLFHSHITDDNDRCMVFDRVRMEIKGGPGSNDEAKHPINSTSFYRWKFQLPANFEGASSFCHIFQNKIFGGEDSSFPLITFTPRQNVFEIIHNGGATGNDLGVIASADLDLFKGKWIEAFVQQYHAENGKVEIILKDLVSGDVLISYKNENIDLWREGAEYDRPKWGMYRKKSTNLKDETIRFADFCISEQSSSLCPAESIVIIDTIPPAIPKNLTANSTMIHSVNLSWDKSTDNFGIKSYLLFQDDVNIWQGQELSATIDQLEGSSTYAFSVSASDLNGNISEKSLPLLVTTADSNTLPSPPSLPYPADQTEFISPKISLKWLKGDNTTIQSIALGTSNPPTFIQDQTESFYDANLIPNTKYFWQIVQRNENGETNGPIWTFTTGDENTDLPWKVYRANERIDRETNFMVLNEIPENPLLDMIVSDSNGSGNKIYGFWDNGEAKFRWRYNYDTQDTAITIVARIKAINSDVNCVCYFETRGFGYREKIRVNQSTVKLERSSPLIETSLPFDINKEFHIIRITMKGNETTVFLDENPVPFTKGSSTDEDTNAYFEFGKSGSNECGGYIDWMTILPNEIYPPNEGPSLPGDLFLSSDATLKSITLDGILLENFNPYHLDYDVELENATLPKLEYIKNSELSIVDLVEPETIPNSFSTLLVTAQDGFSTKLYTINYLSPSSNNGVLLESEILVYPNPLSNELNINLELDASGRLLLMNSIGIQLADIELKAITTFDMSDFPAGIYYLVLDFNSNQKIIKKIIKI